MPEGLDSGHSDQRGDHLDWLLAEGCLRRGQVIPPCIEAGADRHFERMGGADAVVRAIEEAWRGPEG